MQLLDLHYKIGKQILLSRISVHFQTGINAVIGINGCGKSSLLRILSGICQPHAGKVFLQHQDLYASPKSLKQRIGYVPTASFLYPRLTVLENLKIVGSLRNLQANRLKCMISQSLQQWDLEAYQKVIVEKLSDGQKKRVMIACALIHQPQILILDEPCENLDSNQRQHLWQFLTSWQKHGLVILTSHHLDEIAPLCEKVYQLHEGQLKVIAKDVFSQTILRPSSLIRDTSDVKNS